MPEIKTNELSNKSNNDYTPYKVIELSSSSCLSSESQEADLSSDSDVQIISHIPKDESSDSDVKSVVTENDNNDNNATKLNGITDAESIFYVEKILDSKISNGRRLFLLKWEGYSNAENTWEPEENVNSKDLIDEYFAMEELNKRITNFKQCDEAVEQQSEEDIQTNNEVNTNEQDEPISGQSLFDRIPSICISKLPLDNDPKLAISMKISTNSLTRQQSVSIIENSNRKSLKRKKPASKNKGDNDSESGKSSKRVLRSTLKKDNIKTRSSTSQLTSNKNTVSNHKGDNDSESGESSKQALRSALKKDNIKTRSLTSKLTSNRKTAINTTDSSKQRKTKARLEKISKKSLSKLKKPLKDSNYSPSVTRLRSRNPSMTNSIDSSTEKRSALLVDVSSRNEDAMSLISSENSPRSTRSFLLRQGIDRTEVRYIRSGKIIMIGGDTRPERSLRSTKTHSYRTQSNYETDSVADSLDISNLTDDDDDYDEEEISDEESM